MGRDIRAGAWVGPHVACLVTKDMLQNTIQTLVCQDRMIYKENIPVNVPCLIMIPMRIGTGNGPFPKYKRQIMRYCQIPFFVGILGGKPRHALYITGYELENSEKNFVAIDPHSVNISNAFLPTPRSITLGFESIDPCLAVCFLVHDKQEVDELFFRLSDDPLIGIADKKPKLDGLVELLLED